MKACALIVGQLSCSELKCGRVLAEEEEGEGGSGVHRSAESGLEMVRADSDIFAP